MLGVSIRHCHEQSGIHKIKAFSNKWMDGKASENPIKNAYYAHFLFKSAKARGIEQ